MKLPELPKPAESLPVNFYLPKDLLDRIDTIVSAGGYKSRSVVVRSFLEAAVGEFEDQTLRMERYRREKDH